MFSLIIFLFLENSKVYAEHLLLTCFQQLLAQAHICIIPIINTHKGHKNKLSEKGGNNILGYFILKTRFFIILQKKSS